MSRWRPRPPKPLTSRRRYLGSWTLPSGNSCDVYLTDGQLACEWDRPPSPSWPRADVEHWQDVIFPAILRAVSTVTSARTGIGISL